MSNDWIMDGIGHWSLNSNGLSNWDIMDDLSDRDFWLDLGNLWGDLCVGSDWGQDLLLGHKWSEVTSLGGSESDNWLCDLNWGWCNSDWGSDWG
jgi:hypothetical protein